MAQPALSSENGVIVTVGCVTNNDRWEIVMPFASIHVHDGLSICSDAGIGFAADALPLLVACLSSDTQVMFIQVEGMVDGSVPARKDYAPGAQVGTRAAGTLPTSVAALIDWYGDPAQTLPSGRTRIGKNFIAGIAATDVVGDHVQSSLGGVLQAFGLHCMDGFTGGDGTTLYYRVIRGSDRVSGQTLANARAVVIREYVVTQRRRLTPH